MSLFPFFDAQMHWTRPSRLLDQHFGLPLTPEDFFEPITHPRHLMRSHAGYLRPWRLPSAQGDAGSVVMYDKDKFEANLDVQQFKPNEISVKLAENMVTVEGRHEEKEDEHGYISRHFVRRYMLPKDCDFEKVESKLSSDGVLTIVAPKKEVQGVEQKNIPITQTGAPLKKTEAKEKQ